MSLKYKGEEDAGHVCLDHQVWITYKQLKHLIFWTSYYCT